MPPEQTPQDPQQGNKPENKPAAPTSGQVDIDKILLPKKEVPGATVDSARRVSAGALLDQEIKAGTEGLPKQPLMEPKPAPPPAPSKDESIVKPLTTYQGAIEDAMKGGDVSIVSIAAAEAQRRAQKGAAQPQEEAAPTDYAALAKKYAMVAAGVLLILVAASALGYFLTRPTTVPVATQPTAPFIAIDDAVVIPIASNESNRDILKKLDEKKMLVGLPLGLISRLVPSVASSTPSGEVLNTLNAQVFLSRVAPNMPTTLLRTIEPTYLLGVHVYNGNQPFFIFRIDSYQEAFSGMLEWEASIRSDLIPLFSYTPRAHIPEENVQAVGPSVIVSTASSSASSTPATSTQTTTPSAPTFAPLAKFVDKIVENHDARVLQNEFGDIYLLWTFLDRNTLVITTNAATLREIISRLQNAPITTVPGQ